jgi:GNAT superfamily N-acetyltransferase
LKDIRSSLRRFGVVKTPFDGALRLMKLSEYLRNHNELVAMLLDGDNPHAMRKLPQDDVELLRNQLERDERIRAYVIGRVVGAGRGVWVLTDRSLIALFSVGRVKVRKLELSSLETVESERGHYGQTLRVRLAGQALSLYGCDTTYAELAARALSARHPGADDKAALDDEALADALHAFADLGLRAQPLAQAEVLAQQLMEQAIARARADGLVKASELAG